MVVADAIPLHTDSARRAAAAVGAHILIDLMPRLQYTCKSHEITVVLPVPADPVRIDTCSKGIPMIALICSGAGLNSLSAMISATIFSSRCLSTMGCDFI